MRYEQCNDFRYCEASISESFNDEKKRKEKPAKKGVLPHYWPQSLLWPLIAMIVADVGCYGCSFLYIKVIRIDRKKRK